MGILDGQRPTPRWQPDPLPPRRGRSGGGGGLVVVAVLALFFVAALLRWGLSTRGK